MDHNNYNNNNQPTDSFYSYNQGSTPNQQQAGQNGNAYNANGQNGAYTNQSDGMNGNPYQNFTRTT